MNIVVTKTFGAIKEILPFEFNAFLSQLAEASAKPDAVKLFRITAACDSMVQLLDKGFTNQMLPMSRIRLLGHVLAQIGGTQTNVLSVLCYLCYSECVGNVLCISCISYVMRAAFGRLRFFSYVGRSRDCVLQL